MSSFNKATVGDHDKRETLSKVIFNTHSMKYLFMKSRYEVMNTHLKILPLNIIIIPFLTVKVFSCFFPFIKNWFFAHSIYSNCIFFSLCSSHLFLISLSSKSTSFMPLLRKGHSPIFITMIEEIQEMVIKKIIPDSISL